MPRYCFHVFNDDHTIDDAEREFPNIDQARIYAINCIRGIMADELTTRGQIDLKHWIEIEDGRGNARRQDYQGGRDDQLLASRLPAMATYLCRQGRKWQLPSHRGATSPLRSK